MQERAYIRDRGGTWLHRIVSRGYEDLLLLWCLLLQLLLSDPTELAHCHCSQQIELSRTNHLDCIRSRPLIRRYSTIAFKTRLEDFRAPQGLEDT